MSQTSTPEMFFPRADNFIFALLGRLFAVPANSRKRNRNRIPRTRSAPAKILPRHPAKKHGHVGALPREKKRRNGSFCSERLSGSSKMIIQKNVAHMPQKMLRTNHRLPETAKEIRKNPYQFEDGWGKLIFRD